MKTLEDTVLQVVEDFVSTETLFTALDVSNMVKMTLPLARHREVRDQVRNLFSFMESAGYTRSTIQVTLADGSTTAARLYHHVGDTWDIDNLYSAQQRAQLATSTAVAVSSVMSGSQMPLVGSSIPNLNGSLPVTVKDTPTVTMVAKTPATSILTTPTPPTRDLWDAMFKSKPSLFPRG